MRVPLHGAVEGFQLRAHLLLQICDESLGLEGHVQFLVIGLATLFEIGRKVLIGVAVPVGAAPCA